MGEADQCLSVRRKKGTNIENEFLTDFKQILKIKRMFYLNILLIKS